MFGRNKKNTVYSSSSLSSKLSSTNVFRRVYIPGIIGKGGQFSNRFKHTAKTGLVKVLPTWPAKERNGMFVIHHCNIYNSIKAASLVLSKIRTIQSFQQKLQGMSNILPSDQKVNQSCVFLAKTVDERPEKHTNKKPEHIQMDITKEKDVDKATETNYKTSVNCTIKPENTENHNKTSMVKLKPCRLNTNFDGRTLFPTFTNVLFNIFVKLTQTAKSISFFFGKAFVNYEEQFSNN